MTRGEAHVVVVGGGLAGIAAALESADRGARVTLLERRRRLGGLTWSFEHGGLSIDNGQHVFLRCCTEYRGFLARIGATRDVHLQDRLDIPVVAPESRPGGGPRLARLRRSGLPAPLHLLGSLAGYAHLGGRERLGLGRAALPLRALDLGDPRLDGETFGAWLERHGQSPDAIGALWDLITVPTVNLRASEASLAMGAKVFQTGLLTDRRAADIGWSRVPLGQLHGRRSADALAAAGVSLHLGERVAGVRETWPGDRTGFEVSTSAGPLSADAVVVAVPHTDAASVLPAGVLAHQDELGDLGSSAIVGIHLIFDRPVTSWAMLAGARSPVQFVFDRTDSSGLASSGLAGDGDRRAAQYLAVSLSAADDLLARHPRDLAEWTRLELARLLPAVADARLVESVVTKERNATFRARPGTAGLRPSAPTLLPGLAVAGAWTDTGWPATMEGAVRSGKEAARSALSGAWRRSSPTKEVA